jgi:hypothetical protein
MRVAAFRERLYFGAASLQHRHFETTVVVDGAGTGMHSNALAGPHQGRGSGDTSASRRYGLEWTNRYRPVSWLDVDADLAMSHARFLGFDGDQAAMYDSLAGFPQAQIGNAPGNYIICSTPRRTRSPTPMAR